MKKKSNALHTIVTVIGVLLCVTFGLMLLFNITIIVKGLINSDTPPSVFGVTPLVVKSGSMSSDVQHKIDMDEIIDLSLDQIKALKVGDHVNVQYGSYKVDNVIVSINNDSEDRGVDFHAFYLVERPAADHIEVGDLIFTKQTDPADVKVGDVISYMEGHVVITHRVIDINNANGLSFITKGDANNSQDNDPIAAKDLVGIYKSRIPGLGDFIYFLQKPLGMVAFIGVPVIAFIVFDIIRRNKAGKKEETRTEELEKELERLRALAKQQEEQNKASAETSSDQAN